MNCLAEYITEELTWREWSLAELAEQTGVEEAELAGLLDADRLDDWPSASVVRAIARAFRVPTRDLVLLSARAAGLPIAAEERTADLGAAANEELMRELRRRLALGATSGNYLATTRRGHLSAVPRTKVG
ncbi:MAG TPA: hypothetical protein VH915_11535 [Pedococcus sp.]|jgi:transcriptional regulator with XRE-family HTH domain